MLFLHQQRGIPGSNFIVKYFWTHARCRTTNISNIYLLFFPTMLYYLAFAKQTINSQASEFLLSSFFHIVELVARLPFNTHSILQLHNYVIISDSLHCKKLPTHLLYKVNNMWSAPKSNLNHLSLHYPSY